MPIYEYGCQRCGKFTDVMQKLNDPAPARCDSCGAEGAMQRVISRTSFVLKGGGWYSDLYGSPKKEAAKPEAPASGSSTAAPAAGAPAAPSSTGATGGGSEAGTKPGAGTTAGSGSGGGPDKK